MIPDAENTKNHDSPTAAKRQELEAEVLEAGKIVDRLQTRLRERDAALRLSFSWIAVLPEGRPDSSATCAFVPRAVYEQIKEAIK